MDLSLQAIITSGIVSSIVGFIFKQVFESKLVKLKERLNAQNKELEIELTSLKSRERHDYEMIIQSLKKIWSHFSNIEDYFILGILDNFNMDTKYEVVRKEAHKIRNEMLLLPDELYQPIDRFLNEIFSVHIQNFHESIGLYTKETGLTGIINIEDNPDAFKVINAFISDLQSGLWFGRDNLRKEIRKHLSDYFKTF